MSSLRVNHFVSCAILVLASVLVETSRGEKEIVLPRDKFGRPLGRLFTAKKSGGHVDEATVRLRVFQRELVLELELNRNLLPENYVSISFTKEGKMITKNGIDNCFYHGRISGFANSSAVISSCNGLEGVFFYGSDLDTYFYINPVREELDGSFVHSIERASDLETFPITNTCGNESNHTHHFSNPIRSPFDEHEIAKRTRMRIPRDVTGETKYVELLLVNDNSRFTALGSVNAVESQTVRIANIADDNYRRQLNTRVVLVGVITWNNGDQIQVSSVAGTTLARFADYRRTVLSQTVPNDVAHLLTQIDLDGSTVGVAYLSGACTVFGAAGVVQFLVSAEAMGSTLTHELGHNLGMNHDNGRSCDICSDATNGCVMAASFNPNRPPTEFADCSELDYCDYLENGHGSCLFNLPSNAFSPPECGNHFVEEGEECDCGTPAECGDLSKCCNSSTCLLQPGSQCAEGLCCNTNECSFLPAGISCRENVTVCDLTEYCSGDNGECPANIHLQDGTPCFDLVESKCYDGECESRLKQCQSIWGSDASAGDDSCYALNRRGDGNGFCARTNGSFSACEAKDQQCGLLFCSGGSTFPMARDITSTAFFTRDAGCRGAYTADGAEDTPVEGMVNNGITCGQEEICLNQQCVALSAIVTPCPVGENGQVCSGNGVCNSNDECSCDVGFFSPNCTAAPTIATTTTEAVTTAIPTTTSVPTTAEPTTNLATTVISATTAAPTTARTTTASPTTASPATTLSPTTAKPTTAEPVTTPKPTTKAAPTTKEPVTTAAPTTPEPTTKPVTTAPPTTAGLTTKPVMTTTVPTTFGPTTKEPMTTVLPTTAKPTTAAPTTKTATTESPTTTKPTTTEPATTTASPTTAEPTTKAATTESPTTAEPTTVLPTTAKPTTAAPTTKAATTESPTTAEPTTVLPTTAKPTTAAPTTKAATTESPTTAKPTTEAATTESTTTAGPTTVLPTTAKPTTAAPTTKAATTESPTTAKPTTKSATTESTTTAGPTTVLPTTAKPTTAAPTTKTATTESPTTTEPATTTASPTTAEPTTEPATTASPTTAEPTPTTGAAVTTVMPTTQRPTSEIPTTAETTTRAPFNATAESLNPSRESDF